MVLPCLFIFGKFHNPYNRKYLDILGAITTVFIFLAFFSIVRGKNDIGWTSLVIIQNIFDLYNFLMIISLIIFSFALCTFLMIPRVKQYHEMIKSKEIIVSTNTTSVDD